MAPPGLPRDPLPQLFPALSRNHATKLADLASPSPDRSVIDLAVIERCLHRSGKPLGSICDRRDSSLRHRRAMLTAGQP